MRLRERSFRLDHGRCVLLEMWAPGTTFLVRALGTCRICSKACLHMHSDLQAILSLQDVALRLRETFCPPKRVLYEVLASVCALGDTML